MLPSRRPVTTTENGREFFAGQALFCQVGARSQRTERAKRAGQRERFDGPRRTRGQRDTPNLALGVEFELLPDNFVADTRGNVLT